MNSNMASEQWSSRPADQRFWNLTDLKNAVNAHYEASTGVEIPNSKLRVKAIDGKLVIDCNSKGDSALLTNWSFRQLAAKAGAQKAADFIQSQPATMAAQNLNWGLADKASDGNSVMMLHENGGFHVRALTSDKYKRIWNIDVVERLMGLEANGWKTPPARPVLGFTPTDISSLIAMDQLRYATAEQAALSLTVREGDLIGPAGLYASNEDLFVFLLHPDRVIRDGSSEGLMRGVIISNSEVGKAAFKLWQFYFRGVCGNHILHGVSESTEIGIRHVGKATDKAFDSIEVEVKKYLDSSASDMEAKIVSAQTKVLGKTKDEVLDLIFDKKIMSRTLAEQSFDAVVPDIDGDPKTAWGFVQGATRVSQLKKNADARTEIDRAAGRVLRMVSF